MFSVKLLNGQEQNGVDLDYIKNNINNITVIKNYTITDHNGSVKIAEIIEDDVYRDLFKLLETNTTPITLNFEELNLNDSNLQYLFSLVHKRIPISLSLSDENKTAFEEESKLIQKLRLYENSKLDTYEISLGEIKLFKDGKNLSFDLLKKLISNSKTTYLSFNDENLSDENISELAESLKHNYQILQIYGSLNEDNQEIKKIIARNAIIDAYFREKKVGEKIYKSAIKFASEEKIDDNLITEFAEAAASSAKEDLPYIKQNELETLPETYANLIYKLRIFNDKNTIDALKAKIKTTLEARLKNLNETKSNSQQIKPETQKPSASQTQKPKIIIRPSEQKLLEVTLNTGVILQTDNIEDLRLNIDSISKIIINKKISKIDFNKVKNIISGRVITLESLNGNIQQPPQPTTTTAIKPEQNQPPILQQPGSITKSESFEQKTPSPQTTASQETLKKQYFKKEKNNTKLGFFMVGVFVLAAAIIALSAFFITGAAVAVAITITVAAAVAVEGYLGKKVYDSYARPVGANKTLRPNDVPFSPNQSQTSFVVKVAEKPNEPNTPGINTPPN